MSYPRTVEAKLANLRRQKYYDIPMTVIFMLECEESRQMDSGLFQDAARACEDWIQACRAHLRQLCAAMDGPPDWIGCGELGQTERRQ